MTVRSFKSILLLAAAAFTVNLAALSALAEPPAAGAAETPAESPAAESAAPQMPERESQLIEIFSKARKQYDSGHAGVKSKDVRVGLQIQVIEFMEAGQDTKDWVGTVKTRGTSPEGDAWITIEIADGITVSTWQTHFFDQNQGTLIPNYSPLFERAHSLRIGQSVVFSGKIIESVTSNDEEMIVRPQLIARFTALKATD